MVKKEFLISIDFKFLTHEEKILYCKAKGYELLLKAKEENFGQKPYHGLSKKNK